MKILIKTFSSLLLFIMLGTNFNDNLSDETVTLDQESNRVADLNDPEPTYSKSDFKLV